MDLNQQLEDFFSTKEFSYCCLTKDSDAYQVDPLFNRLLIEYMKLIEKWSPKRQKEFLIGRYCAFLSLGKNQKEIISIGEKREPLWPKGFNGSISHNKNLVIAVTTKSEKFIGMDIEEKGRLNLKIQGQILTPEEIDNFKLWKGQIDYQSFLTLIFSSKESIFKCLYPYFKEYFGFHSAYLSDLKKESAFFRLNHNFQKNYPQELIENNRALEVFYFSDRENLFTITWI